MKNGAYDSLFQDYGKELPYDWRILKAQAFQESSFNPLATSPAGAQGLMQFMPDTWARFGSGDPYDAENSIIAAVDYTNYLYNQWKWPRPEIDRICLALASYNAGLGNILKAQKLSGNKSLYSEIIQHLPEVTGQHSKETRDYVVKILGYWCSEVTHA